VIWTVQNNFGPRERQGIEIGHFLNFEKMSEGSTSKAIFFYSPQLFIYLQKLIHNLL
jgi:hypothetical protein